jgi:pyruvate/2-oxoglutarate dehydrogenase complex dihydrolipoamide acyltransferase (E2) component
MTPGLVRPWSFAEEDKLVIYQLVVPGPIEDVEEIRVLEWHRQEGAAFAAGELLVELETHKAVVEVRPSQAGVLRRVLCQPGEWQQVGKAIALCSDGPDEELPGTEPGEAPCLAVEFEIA